MLRDRGTATLFALLGTVQLLAIASGQEVSWVPPAWDQVLPVEVAQINVGIVNDLRRLEAMIAEQNASEAARLLRELRDTSGSLLVAGQRTQSGWCHLIPLSEWLNQQLRRSAPIHPELLAAHRALVDPLAGELWQQGDPDAWTAMVRDFDGSRDADEAAAALAELALERAYFNTARKWWRRYVDLSGMDDPDGSIVAEGRSCRGAAGVGVDPAR